MFGNEVTVCEGLVCILQHSGNNSPSYFGHFPNLSFCPQHLSQVIFSVKPVPLSREPAAARYAVVNHCTGWWGWVRTLLGLPEAARCRVGSCQEGHFMLPSFNMQKLLRNQWILKQKRLWCDRLCWILKGRSLNQWLIRLEVTAKSWFHTQTEDWCWNHRFITKGKRLYDVLHIYYWLLFTSVVTSAVQQ